VNINNIPHHACASHAVENQGFSTYQHPSKNWNWYKISLYQNASRIFFLIFFFLFFIQFGFWFRTENIKPKLDIVPEVPNKYAVEALSLGDKQFYFRFLAIELQNAGDSFGRFTALKNYDYSKLYQWFTMLDTLDNKSRFVPSLAAYYFTQTQKKEDTRYIVQYLDEHSSSDIDRNWWWLFQATMIAKSTLGDKKLALELAYKMSQNNVKEAPIWTKQMPAFIHAELGEDCSAFAVINQILKENDSGVRVLKPEELDFMRYFIKNRLKGLQERKFDPRKCRK